jgi:hypothetical protein
MQRGDCTRHGDVFRSGWIPAEWRPGVQVGDEPRRQRGEALEGCIAPMAAQGGEEFLLERA